MSRQSARVPLYIDKSPRTEPAPEETLAGLATPTAPLRPSSSAMSAHEAFLADPTLYALAVVDEHGAPLGIINRFRFRETLWQHAGDDMLRNRPVAMIMDRTPLILDEHTPIEQLSEILSDDTTKYIFDGFIVTRRGHYLGIGTGFGLMRQITDRRQATLAHLAYHDTLTGLPNRQLFLDRLGQAIASASRNRRRLTVFYIDLDRFKVVNDSLGHLVGDELLTAVSRRLESCLREGDSLARLGGDEFAILLNRLEDEAQASTIAFRIQDALSAPFSIGGREVFTSVSIGIAFSAAQYDNPEEMMRDADTAMYHAKARGKARHELFDAEMHARALDRLGLENDLRQAVKSRGFDVHYQPIVSLTSGMCVGFEALVRWSRNGQATSPEKFIPVAEELGLIESLGTWVLQEACRTFADWTRRYPRYGLECITVNVSTRQLMQPNFLQIVQETVKRSGLTPANLRLEITETTLMGSPNMAAEALRELRDFGVKVYLDDFGTGYSSLSHLHKLPVDALKIDRSFVRSLLLPERPAIVESILALARTLNTGVVAEGVESDLQAQELKRLGCRHAQGYYFSPPLSSPRVEQMLAARRPLGQKQQLETSQRDAIARDLEPFFGPPSPPPPSTWTH
jgi:diguanylate cyclase (GGDEF)-like protein